jgi:type II secretory pathway component GspD/PulD (secretin)
MDEIKMKRVFLCLLFACSSAFAGDYSLDFKDVSVNLLASSVIKGVLKQDYIITPEAAQADQKVSLSVRNLDREGVIQTLNEALGAVNLQLSDRRGVLIVERKSVAVSTATSPALPVTITERRPEIPLSQQDPADGDEPQVYFPKYRGADYLALAVRACGGKLITNNPTQQPAMYSGMMPFGFGGYQPQQQIVQPGQPQTQTNSLSRDVLVFAGRPAVLAKIEKLLAQLDRPSIAVQLRAAILEITESNENTRSFGAVLNMLGSRLGVSFGGVTAGSNAITLKGTNLSAIISAVDGDSRFRFLSEPSLRVLEGETAKLTVGQEVPTRGAVQTDKNGNMIQSIEYRTSGLVVELTPTVFESMLRLKIGQQISTFTPTTTSGIDSPTLLKREASTVVQADDGEVIAIAGLEETRETGNTSGFPFLPAFLKNKAQAGSKSQILLLLEARRLASGVSQAASTATSAAPSAVDGR